MSKHTCTRCGSTDVEFKAWVFANTLEFADTIDDSGSGDEWCNDCNNGSGDFTVIKYEED